MFTLIIIPTVYVNILLIHVPREIKIKDSYSQASNYQGILDSFLT